MNIGADPRLGALDSLPQAILIVDAAGRVAYANPAFWRNAGVELAACPPGSPVRDLVRILAYHGHYGAGDPEQLAEAVLAIDRTQPGQRLLRLADGSRCFEVLSKPLPGGGYVTSTQDVTALLRAREQAVEQAQLFESTLARLHGGVALFDAQGRLSLSNPAYAKFTGLTGGLLRPGMTHRDILLMMQARGEYALVDADAEVRERLARDRSRPSSAERRRPSGEVLRLDSQPMPDGGFLVEMDDITALKSAEDEARHRAALLDGVLQALPHGVCVYGPDRRVAMMNGAYARIMEGAPAAIGECVEVIAARRIAAGEYTAEQAAASKARFDAGGAPSSVIRRLRPNGTAIESRTARLPDGGHIVVVTDVTALHRAEAEARQHASVLEAMLATIRHGITLFDPDGQLIAANAKTAELSGMPAATLVPGRRWDDLHQEQVLRGQIQPQAAPGIRATDRSRPQRYTRQRPDGRILEILSEPTPDGGFVVTTADVTEERTIRAELEAARGAAEAGSAAKSRFLATMSHELRTPLNAVIGFSDAIMVERDPGRIAEYAAAINEAGRGLLLLIDDILDVARSETGVLATAEEKVDLAALIQAAAQAASEAADRAGLTLAVDLPPGLPALRSDARRLAQVLQQLLSNAVKFTPAGGAVTIGAGIGPAGLEIRVVDTGIGIAPEDRDRSFEPFTQLDGSYSRRFQGSGLGLYLARTLTVALGGSLSLEDAAGPGLVAALRFPIERLILPSALSA